MAKISEQEKKNRALTLRVAEEINHDFNSGSPIWDEFDVMPPQFRDNHAVYYIVTDDYGGECVVIVSPKWIENWK